jgi:DHA1 family tetracycline resistance protein-like MFS transporter
VPADAQGRIQGSLSSLVSLAGIVAPAIFASSFGFFIGPHTPMHLPGVAFLIAAAVLAGAWIVAWRFTDAAHYHEATPASAGEGEPAPTEPSLQG